MNHQLPLSSRHLDLIERTWTFADPDILTKPGTILRIDVSMGPCELWPLAVRHSEATPASLLMIAREDGMIDIRDGEKLVLEAVPPVLASMDGMIQVKHGPGAEAVCLLYDGTTLLEGAIVEKKASFVSSLIDPKFYPAVFDRVGFRITCHCPSQLSLDMHFDKQAKAHTGIALDHRDGYVNVWRDIYRGGVWVHDAREKLGFFKYKIGSPYTITAALSVDEDGQARVRVCVSSDGQFKALTPSTCEGASYEWISVRESYCSGPQPGRFDVEPLAK